MSNIEVPLTVEVHIAHVRTINVTNLSSILGDLSLEVVLSLLFNTAHFIETIQVVHFVMGINFSCQLMPHCSKEHVVKLVTLVIPLNCLSILELYYLMPLYY